MWNFLPWIAGGVKVVWHATMSRSDNPESGDLVRSNHAEGDPNEKSESGRGKDPQGGSGVVVVVVGAHLPDRRGAGEILQLRAEEEATCALFPFREFHRGPYGNRGWPTPDYPRPMAPARARSAAIWHQSKGIHCCCTTAIRAERSLLYKAGHTELPAQCATSPKKNAIGTQSNWHLRPPRGSN